jgi:hypothetical protein
MFYTGTPEFAFGAGLSYTDWRMGWDAAADEGTALSFFGRMFALSRSVLLSFAALVLYRLKRACV